MNNEEKMVWMYEQVHGPTNPRGSCQIKAVTDYDDWMNEIVTLHHIKDGSTFAVDTKADLLFDYVTRIKISV